jgi:hypothetical protein
VTDTSRRMPLTAEMHVFHAQVGSDQNLLTWLDLQNRGIIANTPNQRSAVVLLPQAPDALDELSFRQQAI